MSSADERNDETSPGPASPSDGGRHARGRRRLVRTLLSLLALVLLAGAAYVAHLEHVVDAHFKGPLWRVPARVYGRPLELYAGRPLPPERLFRELALLGFEEADSAGTPGTFVRRGDEVGLTTRGFRFADGEDLSRTLAVRFDRDRVVSVLDASGEPLPLARLSPPPIGSILPASGEDRIVVERRDVPDLLIRALIAVEDRRFYDHHGIDLRGIARAFVVNVREGSIVQGGSTLTQQLIRSTFLTNRRSLRRKLEEAVMAMALERRYEKDVILEAYLNEVYMGQDGRRAVHGFGLASTFYFDKPLRELAVHEIALLVGMVQGPAAYDPRRHPEAARARRALVLDILVDRGVLDAATAQAAKERPLVKALTRDSVAGYYPAFLDVVRRDLASDYDEDALSSEGLRILTTMDPLIQADVEDVVEGELGAIAARAGIPDSLEAAVVVTSVEGGEVLAVLGGREARHQGYNRALHAGRAVGSILKPVVYACALETGRYTWSTPVADTLLAVPMPDGSVWSPRNFDETFAGEVPLCQALLLSRNVPTVRVGLDVGVESVVDMIGRMGVARELPAYPSLLLGAAPLAPLDVAQLYNTLATGGFVTPLRAVREVLTADGTPLQHYPLELHQALTPEVAYEITRALEATTRKGTARGLVGLLPEDLHVAGKTGTTDDYRDAWFAGYSGDLVAVVWVGRDDNAPTGLTGAMGALPVWGRAMARLAARPVDPRRPPGMEEVWVDLVTGKRTDEGCEHAVELPFVAGRAPRETTACAGRSFGERALGWFRDLFR